MFESNHQTTPKSFAQAGSEREWHIRPGAEIAFTWGLDSLRVLTDISTYWTQLVVTLAIAIERYILITWGKNAKTILTPKRRRRMYLIVIIVVVIIPLLVMTDHFINYDTVIKEEPDYVSTSIVFIGSGYSVFDEHIKTRQIFVSFFYFFNQKQQ